MEQMEQVILDHLGESSSLFGIFPNFVFDGERLISNRSYYEKTIDEYDVIDIYQININEKYEGVWISLHPDDKMERKGKYRNGVRIGKWILWYPNGKKWEEGEYKNDEKNGIWTFWHRNGQKWKEGKYIDGKKNGKWTFWDANGQKIEEGEYHARVDIPNIFVSANRNKNMAEYR